MLCYFLFPCKWMSWDWKEFSFTWLHLYRHDTQPKSVLNYSQPTLHVKRSISTKCIKYTDS